MARSATGLLLALGVGAAALWRAGPGTHPEEPAPSSPSPLASSKVEAPAGGADSGTTAYGSLTGPSPSPAPAPDLDEPAFMARLRGVARTDPTLAVELARQGNRRFQGSPDAPERAWLLIHALARLGQGSEARAEAEDVVNDYPDSPWIREIEQFTGAHRHRDVRVGEGGGVELY